MRSRKVQGQRKRPEIAMMMQAEIKAVYEKYGNIHDRRLSTCHPDADHFCSVPCVIYNIPAYAYSPKEDIMKPLSVICQMYFQTQGKYLHSLYRYGNDW